MLAQARAKLAAGNSAVEFRQADIRDFNLGQRFDAVLMMFTVLGYQLTDADLMGHGPAVLAERPGERGVSVEDGPARISRKTQASLDRARHLCHVTFDLERVDGAGRAEKWQEQHVVRYYFYPELQSALGRNELLLSLRGFPDEEALADERAWNVIGVARAR